MNVRHSLAAFLTLLYVNATGSIDKLIINNVISSVANKNISNVLCSQLPKNLEQLTVKIKELGEEDVAAVEIFKIDELIDGKLISSEEELKKLYKTAWVKGGLSKGYCGTADFFLEPGRYLLEIQCIRKGFEGWIYTLEKELSISMPKTLEFSISNIDVFKKEPWFFNNIVLTSKVINYELKEIATEQVYEEKNIKLEANGNYTKELEIDGHNIIVKMYSPSYSFKTTRGTHEGHRLESGELNLFLVRGKPTFEATLIVDDIKKDTTLYLFEDRFWEYSYSNIFCSSGKNFNAAFERGIVKAPLEISNESFILYLYPNFSIESWIESGLFTNTFYLKGVTSDINLEIHKKTNQGLLLKYENRHIKYEKQKEQGQRTGYGQGQGYERGQEQGGKNKINKTGKGQGQY